MPLFIIKHKPQLLFHHTACFPWHALFLNCAMPSFAVSGVLPSNLSGIRPVCTFPPPLPYPLRSSHLVSGSPILSRPGMLWDHRQRVATMACAFLKPRLSSLAVSG